MEFLTICFLVVFGGMPIRAAQCKINAFPPLQTTVLVIISQRIKLNSTCAFRKKIVYLGVLVIISERIKLNSTCAFGKKNYILRGVNLDFFLCIIFKPEHMLIVYTKYNTCRMVLGRDLHKARGTKIT
jgi:hypothetical protein